MIVNYPDERSAIQHRGTDLPLPVFDKIQTINSAAIAKNKQLAAALAFIQKQQATFPAHKRRLNHRNPTHHDQPDRLKLELTRILPASNKYPPVPLNT